MKIHLWVSLLVLASFEVFGGVSPVLGPASFASDDAFLDYVEHQTFNYFWEEANPTNGLVRDRSTRNSPCSIAAVGFGLSSLAVASERGWLPRPAAAARVLTTLQTLYQLPQGPGASGVCGYKGWFYHFLDLNTGLRCWRSELSTIDTVLLMLGVV
ncbi:MAG TPA: hypothetical protein VNZ22_18155, partial [Bacillota bacterium]|nr:hypothetical protein [Bacillota bacterium]